MNQRIQQIFVDLNILKLNLKKDSKPFKYDKKYIRNKIKLLLT